MSMGESLLCTWRLFYRNMYMYTTVTHSRLIYLINNEHDQTNLESQTMDVMNVQLHLI